jgi:hypothetical protein
MFSQEQHSATPCSAKTSIRFSQEQYSTVFSQEQHCSALFSHERHNTAQWSAKRTTA